MDNKSKDVTYLLNVIRKRIQMLLTVMVLAVLLSSIYSFYYAKEVYEAKASFYIKVTTSTDGENKNTANYEQFLISDVLVKNYCEMFKQRSLIEKAFDDLKIKDIKFSTFDFVIAPRGNTHILELLVRDHDPERAANIANKLVNNFQNEVALINSFSQVVVLGNATIPDKPTKPKHLLDLAVGIIAGVFLSIFLIFLTEYFSTKILVKNDILYNTDLKVLCTIPKYKKGSLSANEFNLSDINDLGTNVQYAKLSENSKVFAITSCEDTSGKSTLAVSLATLLAKSGSKTILVDMDFKKPAINSMLNLETKNNFMEILKKSKPIDNYIVRKNNIDNLDILMVNERFQNPLIVNMEIVKEIISTLKSKYDYVIIDTSNVNVVNDSLVLCKLSDRSILVCRKKNALKNLKTACNYLKDINTNILGIVFNKFTN